MKIGVCINMNPLSSRSPEYTGIEHIDLYRQAGFDYLELPCAALMGRPEKERRQLEEKALSFGIPCRAVNTLFPATLRVTGADVDRTAVDAYIDDVCAMAARLGAAYIVFGSGGARNVPMGFPKDMNEFPDCAAFMKRFA